MYESCDTTALALDVLENQPDAHKILGDLLEEMGDTAGAQFARGDRKTPRKRLDLAIGLLPILKAAEVACEFYLHIWRGRPDEFANLGDATLSSIVRLKDWCHDPDRPEGVTATCDRLSRLGRDRPRRRLMRLPTRRQEEQPYANQGLLSLVSAVTAAHDRFKSGDATGRLAGRTEVSIQVKKTASMSRDIAARTGYRYYTDRFAWQRELNWQVDHTKSVFGQLL